MMTLAMATGSRESLDDAFAAPDAKRRYVRRLFGTIADRYDFITRFLSFGRDRHWKVRLVDLAGVLPGSRVLDLACGTGDIAFEAARRGAVVVGLDITPRMIELARAKPGIAGRGVSWVIGDMTALPVMSTSFDVITTGYGLRNVPDLRRALSEIHRALRPGGRVCSLDFNRPESAWLSAVYLTYLTIVGSTLGWVLHRDPDTYRYIPASIRRYPGARGVVRLMEGAGFSDVRHIPVLGGFMAIHVARKPHPAPGTQHLAPGAHARSTMPRWTPANCADRSFTLSTPPARTPPSGVVSWTTRGWRTRSSCRRLQCRSSSRPPRSCAQRTGVFSRIRRRPASG
jgi:demethylmenaquinone methyltransferase/2-methoxy-6-polyprenyl-1,4-benzoquinol methylase